MLERLTSILTDPPPAMAFEVSEAGIAAARITSRAELDFQPFKPGTITVSPVKENVEDPDEFVMHLDDFEEGAGYYTGLRFRVYGKSLIAQGGRYDNLYARFGTSAPAIGFTFTIEELD